MESDSMSWFELLKMIPLDNFTLGYVITNAKETEKAIKEIENLSKTPKALKELLRSVENKQLDLQNLKDLYGQPPHGDQTLEQMKENVQKIKEAARFLTTDEVKELVNEATEAKRNNNHQRVDEILENIDQNADLSVSTLKRNRDLRDKLDLLRMKGNKSTIIFDNPPKNKSLIKEFAKLINGTVKGDGILVNFKSESEIVALMSIKMNKKRDKVLDSPEVVKRKEQIKIIYNKMQGEERNLGMKLNIGDNNIEIDDLVRQKKIFVASNKKLELIEPFTGASVIKYVRAVDKTKGSVRAFRPTTLPNRRSLPSVLFLEKSSSNSMNLNPYSSLVITNDFSNSATWQKQFFDTLRSNEMLSIKEAEQIIVEEIYQAVIADEERTISNLYVGSLIGENGIQGAKTKTKKAVKKEIRNFINSSRILGNQVEDAKLNLQSEQLQYLGEDFTIQEANNFEKFYKTLSESDPEDFPMDDLEIKYFRNGRALDSEEPQPILEDGVPKRDNEGNIIFEKLNIRTYANHASVSLAGEKINPRDAYKIGMKATSRDAPESAKGKIDDLIKDLEEKIRKAKEKLGKYSKFSAENLPKDDEGEPTMKPLQLQELQEATKRNIARYEMRLKQTKDRKTSGKTLTDFGEQTAKLRDELLTTDDFADYVVSMSRKLKDKGGLEAFVNTIDRSASALDKITPERSLSFLAQMAEHTNNNEIREAFIKIDSNAEIAKAEAQKLNEQMPNILKTMQEELIGAFKNKLQEFVDKPATFPDNQVINAKKQFINENLIRYADGTEEE
tara:strand:+ start:14224 stop:16581 length:2358 start_codon:yes stop_codon:yes gene_type:complete